MTDKKEDSLREKIEDIVFDEVADKNQEKIDKVYEEIMEDQKQVFSAVDKIIKELEKFKEDFLNDR